MHRSLNATNVFFKNEVWTSSLISWSEIWQIQMKFSNLIINTLSESRTNFMAIGLAVTKSFAEKCRPLCTLVGQCVHAKVMAPFSDSKNQLDALIQSAYILMDLWAICS